MKYATTVVFGLPLTLILVGCIDDTVQFSPSFTIVEVADSATGQKLRDIDLSSIGIAVRFPGIRIADEVRLKPTDDGGRTVIPIGFLGNEAKEPLQFDVIVGSDVIRVSNSNQAVALGYAVMVSVLDTSADPPDLSEPFVIPNSLPPAIAIGGIVTQIVICSNSDSIVEWRLASDIANGRFVSAVVIGESISGFIDTTTDGGIITTDGEIQPPKCPFNVLNGNGSTVGIKGAFNLGDFQRSAVERS